jgi:hypothetical protein
LLYKESGAAILTLLWWHYNWPVKVKSISQFHREFMLLPVHKISSAANTTSFRVNYCCNTPTHLRVIVLDW